MRPTPTRPFSTSAGRGTPPAGFVRPGCHGTASRHGRSARAPAKASSDCDRDFIQRESDVLEFCREKFEIIRAGAGLVFDLAIDGELHCVRRRLLERNGRFTCIILDRYGRQASQDAEATARRKQNAQKNYINHDQRRTGSAGQSMGAGASKWDMRSLRPTGSVYRRRRHPIFGGPSTPQTCGRWVRYANERGRVCPNCHRRLHFSENARAYRETLYGKVAELVRE